MRQPKTNAEILEWFTRGHDELKVNNLRVENFKLYNYGTLIAWFNEGKVEITDRSYSVTTSRICNQLAKLVEYEEGISPERVDPDERGLRVSR